MSLTEPGTLWRQVNPLSQVPYRYTIGVRPLEPARITKRTELHAQEIEAKRAVERDPRRVPYAALGNSDDAQAEVVRLLLAERPEIPTPLDPSLPPLQAVARSIQEDMLLLREDDQGELRLIAGALYFPSAWSLAEKLGQEFLEFHGPVKGFSDSDVGAKSRQFLGRLQPGKPVWRSNWTLQAGDRLDTSPENRQDWIGLRKTVTRDNALTLVHLRIEYQKLFCLAETRAILFSIHTFLVPLGVVLKCEPERENLVRILETLDPEIAHYKGLDSYLATVIGVLGESD